MFKFLRDKPKYRKGQLAPFFIVIIILMIVAALITVNLGKIGKTRTYSSNSSDSGALAAASTLAYAFNYVAKANEQMQENYNNNFNPEAFNHFQNALQNHMFNAMKLTIKTWMLACPKPCEAMEIVPEIQESLEKFIDEMTLLKDTIIPNYHDWQQEFYEVIRKKVDDDERAQGDEAKGNFYENALVAGYKFNLLNSGIAVKEGMYRSGIESFIEQITVDSVTNNEDMSYPFPDPSGRQHEVIARINIDPIRTYEMVHTNMDLEAEQQTLQEAIKKADEAIKKLDEVREELEQACDCKECCLAGNPACCLCWIEHCTKAMQLLMEVFQLEKDASQKAMDAWEGLQVNGSCTSSDKTDTVGEILCWIQDIEHTRKVESFNDQMHQDNAGEKSSELFKTEYPDICTSSRATFNYNDKGQIDPPTPEHDAALEAIDF